MVANEMPLAFVAPSQSIYLHKDGKIVGHIAIGGPILKMPCLKKIQLFEMHNYFGPIPCKKNGDESKTSAKDFWFCYERWNKGGKFIIGELCVVPDVCHACEGRGCVVEQIGPRSFNVTGTCEHCHGSKIEPVVVSLERTAHADNLD